MGFENIIHWQERFYKSSGFLPAFRQNVFFGVSGQPTVLTCKQVHMYQKFDSRLDLQGHFRFSCDWFISINLTDQSNGKEAELKSYKDHCRLSLSRLLARHSKANLGITQTESLFAG